MESSEIVDRGTILRATVGSTVHGLHHGGQDDRDEMAVYVEPPEYMIGLARARGIRSGLAGFEHYVERTQPEGARSATLGCTSVAFPAISTGAFGYPVALAAPESIVATAGALARLDGIERVAFVLFEPHVHERFERALDLLRPR